MVSAPVQRLTGRRRQTETGLVTKMKSPLSRTLTLALLMVLVVGLALTTARARVQSGTGEQRTVVGATPTAILIWLASDLGYLDRLPVDLVRMRSGIATGQAVIDGKAHLATSSDFAFTARALEHQDLRLLATMSSSQTARLVARASAYKAVRGDMGKLRYAVTRNGIGHYFLSQYLAFLGLNFDDVEVRFMPPADIVEAVLAGTVDAALTWEPHVSRLVTELAGDVIRFEDQMDQFYYFSLYGKKDWIGKNHAVLARFLGALRQAQEFARSKPEESIERVSRVLDIEPDVLAGIWQNHTLQVLMPNDIPLVLEQATEWRIREGLVELDAIPNVLEFIEPTPLRTIAPDSVHLLW